MPEKVDLYSYTRFHKTIPHQSNYPIISNVLISATGLVTWTTDIASTSQVLYGLTPYLGALSTYDSTLVTSHSVQLSGITGGLLYYLKVQSFYSDALSISDLYTFIYNPTANFILAEDGSYILLEDGTKIILET